jgi:hypothetical protein
MKAGIENSNLGNSPQKVSDNLHAFQFSSVVERSEGRDRGNRRFHARCDDRWLLMSRTAVDHSMSYDINGGGRVNAAGFPGPQSAQQMLYRAGTRQNLKPGLTRNPA